MLVIGAGIRSVKRLTISLVEIVHVGGRKSQVLEQLVGEYCRSRVVVRKDVDSIRKGVGSVTSILSWL